MKFPIASGPHKRGATPMVVLGLCGLLAIAFFALPDVQMPVKQPQIAILLLFLFGLLAFYSLWLLHHYHRRES